METAFPSTHSDDAPRLELLHGWNFLPDIAGRLGIHDLPTAQGWRHARVGIPWTALFPDLRDYMGVAWYRTYFDVPQFSMQRHVIIKFGAVDYFAEVFINGTAVGTHEGGYTPFSFDVTLLTKPGLNELAIRVIDPPMDEQLNRALCPEMMYNEIPHGKQNWYLQNAGIWQGVRVEFCPIIYIESAHVTPSLDGNFSIDLQLSGKGLLDSELCQRVGIQFSIYDSSRRIVFEDVVPAIISPEQSLRGQLKAPRLWSPDEPNLYILEVALTGELSYRKRVRFGFRTFEAREGQLFLNNKPFYMFGTLDQDFYPETIHTPASEEFVRDMMLKAKRIGINTLRCHLKVCHPVYLTIADEVGMLVWCEMPSWSDCWYPSDHFSLKAAERGRHMFEEMLARDWNHASIVVQTIMNESWGINLKDATQRTWLKNTFNWMKELVAPLGRLVVDNSACEGNFHIKSDLEDFHNYFSMPDQVSRWERFTSDLCTRPDWTYSPFGDAERTGSEPIMVSEFGNWGLPQLPTDLPWWFDRDFGGREITRPAGVLERFKEYRLDTLFEDYNSFAEETQWHQFISLKHEIEDMRMHPQICGYVITGMTDINWEANGLLDMWRNPKVFTHELAKLQRTDLIMLRPSSRNYYADQEISVEVLLSHYSVENLAGMKVRWTTDSGANGALDLKSALPPASVYSLGEFRFFARGSDEPTVEHVYVQIRNRQGVVITENSCDLFIYPTRQIPDTAPIVFRDPVGSMGSLAQSMEEAGYHVAATASRGDTLISSVLDEVAEAHAGQGGRLLLLLNSTAALPEGFPLRVLEREGCELDGRWFSNYNWVRIDRQPFQAVGFGKVLGFESRHVAPRFVIDGVPPKDFDKLMAGVAYGWIASNMALAVPLKIGNGFAFATTFRFEKYGTDPYATSLLDSFLRFMQNEETGIPVFSEIQGQVS